MNIEKLLLDYNINIAPPGDSNYHEGWANVQCPFCGDHSTHLGFNLQSGYANCWRCGWHPTDKAISKLIKVSIQEARDLLKEYGQLPGRRKAKEIKRKIRRKEHRLPSDTNKIKSRHKKYLINRGFDPEKLEEEWNLLGTGPLSTLDKTSYKHRILAPIFWNGKQVSFQTRDITDRHPAKYMACPEDRELIKHKHILYGKQSEWEETGIAVEGITDVWRLGSKAFATFGIKFTNKQIRVIAKNFMRVLILFDEEDQAQEQAKLLDAELTVRGVEAIRIELKDDPASLTEQQAKTLIKKIY